LNLFLQIGVDILSAVVNDFDLNGYLAQLFAYTETITIKSERGYHGYSVYDETIS